ncbi:hypothetical protein BC940DRAFT_344217 [Gongronella butleri]|nr:hypothetical protein BC940DRAFT_344217 [Gongronella butleri]
MNKRKSIKALAFRFDQYLILINMRTFTVSSVVLLLFCLYLSGGLCQGLYGNLRGVYGGRGGTRAKDCNASGVECCKELCNEGYSYYYCENVHDCRRIRQTIGWSACMATKKCLRYNYSDCIYDGENLGVRGHCICREYNKSCSI